MSPDHLTLCLTWLEINRSNNERANQLLLSSIRCTSSHSDSHTQPNLMVFLEYFAQEFVVFSVLLAFNFSIPQVKHQEKYPESFGYLYSTSFPPYESCIGQKCAHITVQLLSVNYFGGNLSCDLAVTLLQVWGIFQVKDNYPSGRSSIDVF